jgi:hypothetical protein
VKRIVVFLGLIVVLAAACSRHDDSVPPPLGVATAPAPSNFTVATTDFVVWNLSWTISDATNIRFYHIYTQDPFTGLAAQPPVDTVMTTSVQINTIGALPGLVWGVASVSNDNVESTIIFDTAP